MIDEEETTQESLERALGIFNSVNMVLGQHGLGDVMTALGLLLGAQAQGDKEALARWLGHIATIGTLYAEGHIVIDDLRASYHDMSSPQ